MPQLDESLASELRLRLIAYGPGKSRKTWWAGTAAEAGFNVILLDGEQGAGILKNIAPEARKRIYRIDLQDTRTRDVMAETLVYFCKLNSTFFDEVKRQRVSVANENCIQFDWSRLDGNTVVVVDSYSALVWSLVLRYCRENSIDLSAAEKTEWEGYRWCGQLATWILTQLSQLPCHLIVIGHQEVYEKRKDGVVEWARTQMKSVSGPHAMQLAKMFDDVLYFSIQGQTTYIDARPAADRDGGGRYLPPKRYTFDELKFANLCKEAGVQLPPADLIPVTELLKVQQPVQSQQSTLLKGGNTQPQQQTNILQPKQTTTTLKI